MGLRKGQPGDSFAHVLKPRFGSCHDERSECFKGFTGKVFLIALIFPHSIGFSGRQMASDGEGSSTLDFLLIPDARSQDQP